MLYLTYLLTVLATATISIIRAKQKVSKEMFGQYYSPYFIPRLPSSFARLALILLNVYCATEHSRFAWLV